MKWHIWENKEENSVTLCLAENSSIEDRSASVLLKEFEADTFEEACQIYYDLQGWGKYIPPDWSVK